MADPLFREQVVENRRKRLLGNVVLADPRLATWAVLAVSVLFLLLVVWAMIAEFPRTEMVKGTVVTASAATRVYPPRPGTVERLFVANGDHVRAGDALAYIGLDIKDASRRGAAEAALDAMAAQKQLVEVRRQAERQASAESERLLETSIRAATEELHSVERQISIQRDIVDTGTRALERLAPLADQGLISRMEFDQRRQNVLQSQQSLEQLLQKSVQLQARTQEMRSQLATLPTQSESRRAELEGELQVLGQQESRARVERGYTLTAPRAGRITSAQIDIGRLLDTRLPALTIIPSAADFQVDVFAPSRAIGFIRPGQEVRLMFDAFPYKQFGSHIGTISSISASALSPEEVDASVKFDEPVYRVRVLLDKQTVPAYGHSMPLQAGMTLTASIILERRKLIDWILEPVNAVRRRT